MISLEVEGRVHTNFDEIEVTKNLDQFSGTFRFTARGRFNNPFPITNGASCRVLVDNLVVMTGFIEVLSVEHSVTLHDIILEGRDKTADIIDSFLEKGVSYTSPLSLKALIELILLESNITGIKVIDRVGNIERFSAEEKIVDVTGESVFSLIESYCRKRQVLLSSDENGNIVLLRGSAGDTTATLINDPSTPEKCNIIHGRAIYNDTNKFYKYVIKSQTNLSSTNLFSLGEIKESVRVEGVAIDRGRGKMAARKSRTFVQIAEKSSNTQQCQKRADWQANINRARSFTYHATVQGHKNLSTGGAWESNKSINVIDVYAGLRGKFLIDGITYAQSVAKGSTTVLRIVANDAYTLEPTAPISQETTQALF